MVDLPKKPKATHSGVRSSVEGDSHIAFDNLGDARSQDEAFVILEGDYGGTIYMTVPVAQVNCDDATLKRLLLDVDAMCWADPEGAGMFFECRSINSGVAGGMGGGLATDSLWLHPEVEALGVREEIAMVIERKKDRIESTDRSWYSTRRKPKLP